MEGLILEICVSNSHRLITGGNFCPKFSTLPNDNIGDLAKDLSFFPNPS